MLQHIRKYSWLQKKNQHIFWNIFIEKSHHNFCCNTPLFRKIAKGCIPWRFWKVVFYQPKHKNSIGHESSTIWNLIIKYYGCSKFQIMKKKIFLPLLHITKINPYIVNWKPPLNFYGYQCGVVPLKYGSILFYLKFWGKTGHKFSHAIIWYTTHNPVICRSIHVIIFVWEKKKIY